MGLHALFYFYVVFFIPGSATARTRASDIAVIVDWRNGRLSSELGGSLLSDR
jgi:hypothetical protein